MACRMKYSCYHWLNTYDWDCTGCSNNEPELPKDIVWKMEEK